MILLLFSSMFLWSFKPKHFIAAHLVPCMHVFGLSMLVPLHLRSLPFKDNLFGDSLATFFSLLSLSMSFLWSEKYQPLVFAVFICVYFQLCYIQERL